MRGERAFRIGAALLASAILFVAVLAIASNFTEPHQTDFVAYWAAARMILRGPAAAVYDLAQHRAVEQGAVSFDGALPFANPPLFLLVLAPFGLLSYAPAAACWTAATAAAFMAAARRFAGNAGWLAFAFPPVLVCAINGQSGFLTAAFLIGGLALLRERPFTAGLLLGCLAIKPQLGLLLPFALLAGREWRAIAGAAVSAAALVALSLLAFGWSAYTAWLGNAPLFASILTEGRSGWEEMASVYAALRLAGAGDSAAWIGHGAVALAAAAAACAAWWSDREPEAKAAVLAAASALASPYLFVYDTLFLVLPLLFLYRRRADLRLLTLLWCLPLISLAAIAGLPIRFNPMPLVAMALLWLCYRSAAQPLR